VPIWKICGFPKVSLYLERFLLKYATAHIQKRWQQLEKRQANPMQHIRKLILGLGIIISLNSYGQGQVFATIAGGDLYSFDLENCTRSFVGSTGQGFGDIAITPNGQLWGTVSGSLYQIDPNTAIATLIGTTGLSAVSLVALNDTILLAESGLNLVGINTNTAESFLIDTIGYQASGDLTWYDDNLFMVTSLGMIISIELSETFSSIDSVTLIGSGIPTCEAAISASFPDEINAIIGFSGPDLLKICPIDGTYEMLCQGLNVGGTPGAAASRLENQLPAPSLCNPTSVEDILNKYDLRISPNPAQTYLNFSTSFAKPIGYGIYNAQGQQVQSGLISDGSKIQIESLESGFYLIRWKMRESTKTTRFIKRK